MTFAATAGLGAVAGVTIFLGLPVARIGRPSAGRLAFLNAASVGVLLFLLYDILKNASEPISRALDGHNNSLGVGYAALLGLGLAAGLLGLVAFESMFLRRKKPAVVSGPGAMAAGGAFDGSGRMAQAAPAAASQRVALFIAVGIGLHNFSEGLAMGQSAAGGVYRLFYLLVIGFGLHNVTEGFGITGPLIGQRPSWRFLGGLGLIAGGPTVAGTVLGYRLALVADTTVVSILFLALAAGAIVYVIGELQHAGRKIGARNLAMLGLLAGFLAGYATDLVLHIAGA